MFYVMTADTGEDAMIEDSLPTREEAQSVADSLQGYDVVFVADDEYVKAHGSMTQAELQRDKEHEAFVNNA